MGREKGRWGEKRAGRWCLELKRSGDGAKDWEAMRWWLARRRYTRVAFVSVSKGAEKDLG